MPSEQTNSDSAPAEDLRAQIAELRAQAAARTADTVSGYAELPQGSDLKLPRLGKPYQPEQLAAEITRVMKSATV